MSENVIYADLNLTQSISPRQQKVTDVQGCTYAEVKVHPIDTNAAASYASPGKRCCSRRHVTVLIAVIILLLALAVCLIFLYHPTVSNTFNSKSSSSTSEEGGVTPRPVLATETGRDPRWPGENDKPDNTGCPQGWEKNGGNCYFFSQKFERKFWNASRKECTDMNSDLVIIDSKEELEYLFSRSRAHYYLLGLTFSASERKWKWINNVEHSTDMFHIGGRFPDYSCSVIGYNKVETAPCSGASTTQTMCKKAANISERAEGDLATRDPGRNVNSSFL